MDPRHRLVVSLRLREEFGDGEQFYAKAGEVIELPARRASRPHREFLDRHLSEIFKGLLSVRKHGETAASVAVRLTDATVVPPAGREPHA